MNSNLSPENEQFLERAVSVGMFHNRDEALDRAVELLRRREQLIRDVTKALNNSNAAKECPLTSNKSNKPYMLG